MGASDGDPTALVYPASAYGDDASAAPRLGFNPQVTCLAAGKKGGGQQPSLTARVRLVLPA